MPIHNFLKHLLQLENTAECLKNLFFVIKDDFNFKDQNETPNWNTKYVNSHTMPHNEFSFQSNISKADKD